MTMSYLQDYLIIRLSWFITCVLIILKRQTIFLNSIIFLWIVCSYIQYIRIWFHVHFFCYSRPLVEIIFWAVTSWYRFYSPHRWQKLDPDWLHICLGCKSCDLIGCPRALWAGFRFVPQPASELEEVGDSMDLRRPGGKDRLKAN